MFLLTGANDFLLLMMLELGGSLGSLRNLESRAD